MNTFLFLPGFLFSPMLSPTARRPHFPLALACLNEKEQGCWFLCGEKQPLCSPTSEFKAKVCTALTLPPQTVVTPRVCQECTPPGQAPHGTQGCLSLPCSLPSSDHTAEQLQRELKHPPCKSEVSKLLREENVHNPLQHFKNANKSHALAHKGAAQTDLAVISLCFSLVQ